jgi:hypothetical protein
MQNAKAGPPRQLTWAQVEQHRQATFRLLPRLKLASRAGALKFVNERGFVFFWPIQGIAFPSHTVVRDLGEEPIFVRANPLEDRVRLNWWSPGTNLVFTVESTASLMPPDWQPIPGTQWPITDRTWTSNSAVTDPYFRVIRATSPGN